MIKPLLEAQCLTFNPLPDMPILGSSHLAANKDMMAKIWTNGDTVTCLSRKQWEKEKFLVTSNFSFAHHVFKSSLLFTCYKYIWNKGLTKQPFTTLRKISFKNIVGNGVNAAINQHFLLFPQCFQPFPKQIPFFFQSKFNFPSPKKFRPI